MRLLPSLALAALATISPRAIQAATPASATALATALAQVKVPPDWFADTPVTWDTNQPWTDARLEIRRLLASDEAGVRQGVKLTWLYSQKGDIGDGHELPMYLFLSGNYAWALQEYHNYLKTAAGKGPTHAYLCLASCYAHFGEHEQALAVLQQALADLPPKPWRIANTANIHNHLGDIYARKGDPAKASEHYQQAIQIYPTSDQPYGRHLLHRHVAKVQTKLDLLALESLQAGQLRDGVYRGRSLGYADQQDVEITLTVRAGRMADLQVKHAEKIELNATQIVPQRILAQQTLKVDGVTGATVTSQAIIDGTFQALKQAGLRK